MIHWRKEKLLTLREVAAIVGVTPQAVHGWVHNGIGGVRLEAIRLGGLKTSEEAVQRFVEATTPTAPNDRPPYRTQASQDAADELERMGA